MADGPQYAVGLLKMVAAAEEEEAVAGIGSNRMGLMTVGGDEPGGL